MNLEFLLIITLFLMATVLMFYLQSYMASLLQLKYIFEATKRGDCGLNYTGGELVVAMCVKVAYNGSIYVETYNVTYPTHS
ncbi:MAG: hypothetical protein ACK4SY_02790 [Pyrobaculum sp.]